MFSARDARVARDAIAGDVDIGRVDAPAVDARGRRVDATRATRPRAARGIARVIFMSTRFAFKQEHAFGAARAEGEIDDARGRGRARCRLDVDARAARGGGVDARARSWDASGGIRRGGRQGGRVARTRGARVDAEMMIRSRRPLDEGDARATRRRRLTMVNARGTQINARARALGFVPSITIACR